MSKYSKNFKEYLYINTLRIRIAIIKTPCIFASKSVLIKLLKTKSDKFSYFRDGREKDVHKTFYYGSNRE